MVCATYWTIFVWVCQRIVSGCQCVCRLLYALRQPGIPNRDVCCNYVVLHKTVILLSGTVFRMPVFCVKLCRSKGKNLCQPRGCLSAKYFHGAAKQNSSDPCLRFVFIFTRMTLVFFPWVNFAESIAPAWCVSRKGHVHRTGVDRAF